MVKDQRQLKVFKIILTLILISIVAAILFPRGVDFWEKAQYSSVEYTALSFSAAINGVHGRWFTKKNQVVIIGKPNGVQHNILLNSKGWPIDSWRKNEFDLVEPQTLNCENLWKVLLIDASGFSKQEDKAATYLVEQKPDYCRYIYTGLEQKYFIDYIPRNGDVNFESK